MAILMVAVLSVGFVSCGDDDDDDAPGGTSQLTGTWKESYHHEILYFFSEKYNEDEKFYSDNEASMGIIFKSDGTMKTVSDLKSDGSYTHVEGEMNYRVQNGHLYLYYPDEDDHDGWEDCGEISFSGNTFELSLNYDYDPYMLVEELIFKKIK